MISMKPVLSFGRIMLGLAYVVYGYLHFAHTAADAAMVPQGVGRPVVWVILILFFAILPDFHGVSSWLSMASVLGLIGGSLQVAAYGEMWYRRKNRG